MAWLLVVAGVGVGLHINSAIVDKIQRFQTLILRAYSFPGRMGKEKTLYYGRMPLISTLY
jgi:hypothetical protein